MATTSVLIFLVTSRIHSREQNAFCSLSLLTLVWLHLFSVLEESSCPAVTAVQAHMKKDRLCAEYVSLTICFHNFVYD